MTDREILKKAIEKYRTNSITGKVFNRKTDTLITPTIDNKGYEYFSLYIGNGKSKKVKVHRLVAFEHIPNPENLPQINHISGNRRNNSIDNLEWCTASHNVSNGFKRGRIVWNKGNASKARIYGYCKKYPRQIFWILTNNDFQFAKAFWGEKLVCNECGTAWHYCRGESDCGCFRAIGIEEWQYHLQTMVLEKEPLKYLERFIK